MAGIGRRPSEDAVLERLHAYADAWLDVAGCTERADRPRTEAALRGLYRRARQKEPEIAWVSSPGAGVEAYVLARISRGRIPSPFAPPDPFRAAALERNPAGGPFPLEQAWALRLARRALALMPPQLATRVANADAADAATLGWSIGRAINVGDGGAAVRLVQREIVESHPIAVGTDLIPRPSLGPALDAHAAAVLGQAWDRIVFVLGPTLARELYAHAVAELASTVVRSRRDIDEAAGAMQPGQFDALTPVLALVREVGRRPLWWGLVDRDARNALVDARMEIARSAGPWWALPGLAIVSERPALIRRDDRARLHASTGPALAYADGTTIWAWRGARVPREAIEHPEAITIESIDAERNAEVRRVLIERFGEERYIRADGATIVSEDETGRLWRRASGRAASRWHWVQPDEPVVMVEVTNTTPESDGTRKTYVLRVPPDMRTAREAVAWTFGMTGEAYRPRVES
jgi:hypothetical protein